MELFDSMEVYKRNNQRFKTRKFSSYYFTIPHQPKGTPREWKTNPLIELNIEFVKGNMRRRYQNLFDERIHSLKNGEIEELGTMLIEIRHQFPRLRHLHSDSETLNPSTDFSFRIFFNFPGKSWGRWNFRREKQCASLSIGNTALITLFLLLVPCQLPN